MPEDIRVMLVDDHDVVRQGLKSLLERREHLRVVAEAGSVAEAISAAARTQPDVIVMDVRLPDGTGIEACRDIRAERPQTRVLMLTSYADEEAVYAAIVAGAAGYLLKQTRGRELVSAIEAVAGGESLLDPTVTGKVLDRMRELATGGAQGSPLRADRAGATDSWSDCRREDQSRDCRHCVPVGEDGQELREHDPAQVGHGAAGAGRGVPGRPARPRPRLG